MKHGFEVWDTNPLKFLRRHYKVGGINTWCYFASVPGSTASHPIDGSPWFTEVKVILWPRDTGSTREEIPEATMAQRAPW
jgi:hypothetical protein